MSHETEAWLALPGTRQHNYCVSDDADWLVLNVPSYGLVPDYYHVGLPALQQDQRNREKSGAAVQPSPDVLLLIEGRGFLIYDGCLATL